ncbi:MAG: hypothetical protein ABIS50_16055 [Luteolibacter sp.]|uniref:hypothetical protein n=1 Tax=Luteolibacter sp. TaxID=1962973 RepID=UPI003267FB97
MKYPHSPRGGSLITGLLAILCTLHTASAASDIPTGTLNVDRTMIRVGSRSNLDWSIQYPSVSPVGVDLIPTAKVKMKVRTLGVAFQSGSILFPMEGSWTKNSSGWTTFFKGTSLSVVPTNVLVDTTINKGDVIKFRGRGGSNALGTSWYDYHQTNTSDANVVVLKNGDKPPSYAPAYSQGNIKSFLTPYLDSTGKIKIGAQDLIILWEGSDADPGTTYFDMQDLVVLVSFEIVN